MAIAALWWSSSSFGVGLGLGEINVASSLSAPFEASITVKGMETVNLDPEQISIRIDGESGANIDYRLERVDADTALIRLYTREAISEPVIQFRVEVTWDRNAVARSYDAFIDPPVYHEHFKHADASAADRSTVAEQPDETMLPAAQLPAVAPADSSVSTAQVDRVQTVAVVIEEPVAVNSVIEPRREYGPTIDGNSIWRVARAVAADADDLTIYQWMYAIWQANPRAFMGGNMHRLNMGEVLAVPLEDEVRELPHAEAWRAYSSQMALLQEAGPVTEEPAQEADVAAERQAEAQSAESSFIEVTGAPVDKFVQIDESAAPAPAMASSVDQSVAESVNATAKEDALIALLEDSASAIDERAIVSANQAGAEQSALEQTTPQLESIDRGEVNTMPAGTMADSAVLDIPGRPVVSGEVVMDDIEAADLSVVAAADQSVREVAPIPAGDLVTDQTNAPANVISEVPVADWYDSLQSRRRFIDSMPVIGGAGSLAFVGRALRRADAFIATSPSWAALAFGVWVTLTIVMLRNELTAWRRRRPEIAAEKSADTADVTRTESSAQVLPSVTPTADERESADKARRRKLPLQPPSESNARAIIAQADYILDGGDSEEAIKLMKLAVELQPNQPMLIIRLLELYHQARRHDAFEVLMNQSLAVLETLDSVDLDRLQAMHSRLLAGTPFPLAHVLAVDDPTTLEKNPIVTGLDDQARHGNVEGGDQLAEYSAQQQAEMPQFAAPATQADRIALDEEFDRDVNAGIVSEGFSNRFDALEEDSASRLDDEDFVETQVIYTSKGVPLRQQAVEQQSMVGEILDLSVTLKEADVYLAYGLYDNAEELLLKGMEVDPDRADFLARLLDAYYATRNVVDFVSCAEVMLDMGEQGREYWEKVEIMGYELAPYNKMFAGGKDRSLSTVELGIPRPETADFDFSDIEEDRGEAFSETEIDSDEGAEALSTELNLDLSASEYDDTADKLDQILSMDASEAPSIPTSLQNHDDEDISTFILDDDDEVDSGAGEGEHMRSLQTSEILAIPETSAGSDSEDNGVFEIDEEDLAIDLAAVSDALELELDGESIGDGGDPDLEFDDEEVMKFTIEDTDSGLAASFNSGETNLSMVQNSLADALTNSSGEKVDGRILYFPENNDEGGATSEFESEVKVTLQAIRDQLQHITERLFRQERETSDLKQSITELGNEDAVSEKKKNNKSS
jgi:FimV-like protein